MRKLCLVPALLLAAASASAETPVKLWNDYVYNQPVESVKAEAGIFDCSQRGQQMFCRANVEFAGHKDWGEVFFFTNGRLKAVSLFAPISRAHFTDAAAAVRKTGMTPAVLTDHEDKVAFDFFQAKLQAKSMASIDRELATKETELLKGKKVGYVFIDAKTLLESVKSGNVTNAAQFFQIHAPRTLRTTEILLDEQGWPSRTRRARACSKKRSPNKPDFPAHATRKAGLRCGGPAFLHFSESASGLLLRLGGLFAARVAGAQHVDHVGELEVRVGEEHEQVIDEVGGLVPELLPVVHGSGERRLDALFAHLLRDALGAAGVEAGGVGRGRIGVAAAL